MNLSERIAEFVAGYPHDNAVAEPPPEVIDIVKLSLLDWWAVGIAGIDEPVSTIVRSQVLDEGGKADSSVFGTDQRIPAKAAALVNGTTSHALDYDDTHFLHVGHTSVVVFSAAKAVADLQRASGSHFMQAALIGSEVCCHVGQWLGRSHYQAGFHQTATAGTFGATAAACRLLDMTQEQTLHALGLAATRASGLTSQFGTMSKPYHAGMAAANGVEAALLAARGFSARPDGIECLRGFADTHHAEPARTEIDLSSLGQHYVFGDVQHKLHACCHGLHASIEALQLLKEEYALSADDIADITIHTNSRWLKVCNVPKPATALESKFSYRHSSALVFSDYDSSALSTYSKACCCDQRLDRVRELTNVIADDSLPDTASSVEVRTSDGRTLKQHYDLADRLPVARRQQRVLAKAGVLLGVPLATDLWAQVNRVEQMGSLDFRV